MAIELVTIGGVITIMIETNVKICLRLIEWHIHRSLAPSVLELQVIIPVITLKGLYTSSIYTM